MLHNGMTCTVKPVLAVTSIKQPTCLKQPNTMFPIVKFVLIFTSVKQPPALSSHLLNTGLTVAVIIDVLISVHNDVLLSPYKKYSRIALYM